MCEIRQQWKQKVNDVLCFGHQSMFFVSFQDNTSRPTALQLPWTQTRWENNKPGCQESFILSNQGVYSDTNP